MLPAIVLVLRFSFVASLKFGEGRAKNSGPRVMPPQAGLLLSYKPAWNLRAPTAKPVYFHCSRAPAPRKAQVNLFLCMIVGGWAGIDKSCIKRPVAVDIVGHIQRAETRELTEVVRGCLRGGAKAHLTTRVFFLFSSFFFRHILRLYGYVSAVRLIMM